MAELSIIIPVYNVSRYIRMCFDSILSQDTRDTEILVIDDGSTDESGRICDEYEQANPCMRVIHKRNEGVSIARNTGIANASGTWISFVDPDDFVSDHYMEFFRSVCGTSTDIAFFSFCMLSPDGVITENRMDEGEYMGRKLVQEGMFHLMRGYGPLGYTVNKFFRREIIQEHQIRFVDRQTYREDTLFTLDYCRFVHSLTTSGQILYTYRIIPGSLSHRETDVHEVFRYADILLQHLHAYDDSTFLSMEYDQLLHVLINVYTPVLPREDKMSLHQRISTIIKDYKPYLRHLKKTRLFSFLYSLPSWMSHPAMELILIRIYHQNG